jgi:hypothetical protein
VSDWFEDEQPLHRAMYDVLDRLRRRAASRWWLVAIATVLLTTVVVRKVALKPRLHRARVILAVSEGDLNQGFNPTPLDELRAYIENVLLSTERLKQFLEQRHLLTDELADGGDAAIEEFRDQFSVSVWRNYFQYTWSYDERRSARVAIAFTSTDAGYAYEMARALGHAVADAEAERRDQAARSLATQAKEISASARKRVDAIARDQADLLAQLAAAERDHNHDQVAVLRPRAAQLSVEWQRATEAWKYVETGTDFDELQAAVNTAGLALEIEIVDERRPAIDHGTRLPAILLVAVVALLLIMPICVIVIGAFDTRVHDGDDVRRQALPLLGHVPGFPGDHIGSLRHRGVGRGRVPLYRRWL